jgi:hypothetical protein
MASDSVFPRWHDVPEEKVRVWREAFDASTEGTDLRASCPVCGEQTLHRWFYLHRVQLSVSDGRAWQGRGSQWQWCSSCRSYEHSSGLVPDWWIPTFEIPLEVLKHDPDAIELLRLQARGARPE